MSFVGLRPKQSVETIYEQNISKPAIVIEPDEIHTKITNSNQEKKIRGLSLFSSS